MAARDNILGDLISTCFFSNEHFALYNHIEHIEISTIVDVVLSLLMYQRSFRNTDMYKLITIAKHSVYWPLFLSV